MCILKKNLVWYTRMHAKKHTKKYTRPGTHGQSELPIHAKIERAILTGELKPRQKITERELAGSFGTSRTPIREALIRLNAFGLVDLKPNGGATIRDFTPKQVADLYSVRVALETLAAPAVVANVQDEDIKRLKQVNTQFEKACAAYDLEEMTRTNSDFHRILYTASSNEFLSKLIRDARMMSYIVRSTGWLNPEIVKKSVKEHWAMIGALERRDLRSLTDVIRSHIVDHSLPWTDGLKWRMKGRPARMRRVSNSE